MNRVPEMHTGTGNRVLQSVVEAHIELEKFVAMEEFSTWMIVDILTVGLSAGSFSAWMSEKRFESQVKAIALPNR